VGRRMLRAADRFDGVAGEPFTAIRCRRHVAEAFGEVRQISEAAFMGEQRPEYEPMRPASRVRLSTWITKRIANADN
jgi:hypothetical protein